jgi:hypothetical protein
MIAKILKFGIKRMLLSMNLDVRRISENPASPQRFADADPITFQYLSDLKVAPVLAIELSQARAGIMGFLYNEASAHPLACAFDAARRESALDDSTSAARRILSDYYTTVQPKTALEVVDLEPHEAPGLDGIPLHSWVMPWSERSIEDTAVHRRICLEEEGFANGSRVSMSDGATLFGPVTEKKLRLETTRVVNLAASMKAKGFQSIAAHPIEVIGLRSDGEYRWLVVQGQHRLAACAAFGISRVPARLVRIIRREDAGHWPHVVGNTFTPAGALRCFDRLFAGTVCSCASSWLGQSVVHNDYLKRREAHAVRLAERPV